MCSAQASSLVHMRVIMLCNSVVLHRFHESLHNECSMQAGQHDTVVSHCCDCSGDRVLLLCSSLDRSGGLQHRLQSPAITFLHTDVDLPQLVTKPC